MKNKVCLAVAIVLCLLTGCKEKKAEEYESAAKKLEQQKFEQAEKSFKKAIKKGNHTVLSWRGIGIARLQMGEYEEAEEAFMTALGIAEKKEKALQRDLYLYLADTQYKQGEYQDCINTCEELLDLEECRDGYFLRGCAYLRRNEYKQAENDFLQVIRGSRDYEDYLEIYMAYRKSDLSADGAEYLEEALKLKGNSPEDFYQRGRIYYYLSEYKNAKKELKKAWEKEYHLAAVYLGKVYAENQEYDKAEEMYKTCLEMEGLEAEGYNGLAGCAAAKGDYEKALSLIEQGLKTKDPEMKQVLLFNQIIYYERNMDFASAKDKMDVYLEWYPKDQAAIREYYFLQTR